jgi:hypothetical protein
MGWVNKQAESLGTLFKDPSKALTNLGGEVSRSELGKAGLAFVTGGASIPWTMANDVGQGRSLEDAAKSGLTSYTGMNIGNGLQNMYLNYGGVDPATLAAKYGTAAPTATGSGYLSASDAAALTDSIGASAAVPAGGGSITSSMLSNPFTNPMSAVGAGDLTLAGSGGLEGLKGMASGGTGSFLSGLSGVKDIARAGSSLYSAFRGKEGADATQNALQTQMSTLTDMYKDGSPWANQLKEQLARQDAAAGRNSQYGSRLAQYQALLADKAGQNAGVLGQLATQAGAANKDSNSYLNLLLNRAGDVSNATGLTKYLEDGATDKVKSIWDSFFGP